METFLEGRTALPCLQRPVWIAMSTPPAACCPNENVSSGERLLSNHLRGYKEPSDPLPHNLSRHTCTETTGQPLSRPPTTTTPQITSFYPVRYSHT
jgi:hypothetical protein